MAPVPHVGQPTLGQAGDEALDVSGTWHLQNWASCWDNSEGFWKSKHTPPEQQSMLCACLEYLI